MAPQGKLRRLEQAFDLNLEPQGLPFDRALRAVLPGLANGALFDWMHALVANGVATWELCGLVQEMRNTGFAVAQVDAWISLHTLPTRLGKLPASFLQQRCSEETLKAFASEVLVLLPVLLAFVRSVVAPSGAMRQHCKCFELLCQIVGILQQGKTACCKELWLYEDVSHKSKFEDEECIEEDRRTHLDLEARQAEPSAPTPQSQPRGGGKREINDGATIPDPKKKKKKADLHNKMQKYLGQISPVKLELQSYLTKASGGEMAKFVPAYVVSHAA